MFTRAVVVLAAIIILGVACSDDGARLDDLETRVATLEQSPTAATSEALIVLGKRTENPTGLRGRASEVCVDFIGFGRERSVCFPIPTTDLAQRCFDEAKIGEPLPDSCR